jgi:hypothetical protein
MFQSAGLWQMDTNGSHVLKENSVNVQMDGLALIATVIFFFLLIHASVSLQRCKSVRLTKLVQIFPMGTILMIKSGMQI